MGLFSYLPAVFAKGRIGRVRYIGCISALFAVGIFREMISPVRSFALSAGMEAAQIPPELAIPVLIDMATIFLMAAFFMIATAQRLRDIGRPGWISLSLVIPLFSIALPVLLFLPRGEERNSLAS